MLFAGVRESVGQREISLDMAEGATVADLRRALSERYPQIQGLAASLSIAVNLEYSPDETVLAPEDEIAVIPPVSGG